MLEPQRRQNSESFSNATASVPGSGVKMHQRFSNRSAKPASGPDFSVPASGWPGMKCTPAGTCGCICAMTDALVEPTSVRIAPGFSAGAISSATSPDAPTGTETTTRSASCTASAASVE